MEMYPSLKSEPLVPMKAMSNEQASIPFSAITIIAAQVL